MAFEIFSYPPNSKYLEGIIVSFDSPRIQYNSPRWIFCIFFRGSLYFLQILNSLREILRRRWRSTKTWRWKWILGDLMLGINAGLLVDQYQLRDGFIYWVYDGYLLNHLPQLVDIASMPILGIWLVSIPKKTSTSIGIDTRHMLFDIKSTWFQVCNTNHLGIPD